MKFFSTIALVCLSSLSFTHAHSLVILNTVINKTTFPVAIQEKSSRQLCVIPQKQTVTCALRLPISSECKGKEGSEAQRMQLMVCPLGGILSTTPLKMVLFFDRIAQWASSTVPSLMLSAGLQTDNVLFYSWCNSDVKLQRDHYEVYLINLTLEGDDFSKSTFTVIPRK